MNQRLLRALCAMACCAASGAMAQAGIYTCTDSKGRRITADRPIPECSDREQRVLSPNGTVKERLGPVLTAEERAKKEARDKLELEERQRMSEAVRRERALLVRYPNQPSHDRSRAEALTQIDLGTRSGEARLAELKKQREKLDQEMEFYQSDPSKAPANLRAQMEENTKNVKVQEMFVSDQEFERRRVNQRFDEELAKLRKLWAAAAAPQ